MKLLGFHLACFGLGLSVLGCVKEVQKPDQTAQVEQKPIRSGHLPSPEDLGSEVLTELRGQLESDDEQHRIHAMQQLSKVRDAVSLGSMIESLEHPNPDVRQQAYDSVAALIGVYLPFDATQPPSTQHQAISFYQEFWRRFKDPESPYMQIVKDPELKRTKYADPSAWDTQ